MVDISKAFGTSSETVSDFFQRPGVGFYIPRYQREYSWDNENVDQLMEDICRGVEALLSMDEKIRFLGTVILVKESNPDANIDPKDKRALPPRIDNVIDGQQRISTIALLACLLYQKLSQITKNLTNDIKKTSIIEAVNNYLVTLLEVFSFDLRRGSPPRKPIIIRGSVDGWTFDGDDKNYQSDVSSFIASFIRSVEEQSEFPKPPKGSLVGKNIKRINYWLNDVEKAHESNISDSGSKVFPPAWEIINKVSQVDLWSYERSDLVSLIKNRDNPLLDQQKKVCSLVQIFAFCHYLLQRCCFTLIEPVSDDWAFDMFQSLNATGTPLTALETFKPLVVNYVKSNERDFKDSKSEKYFAQIDQLLTSLKSAASKNKLTNEYLTLFGTIYNGGKEPSRQFSSQRKWLIEQYNKYQSRNEKEEFIHRMSNLATYWENVIKCESSRLINIPEIAKVDEDNKKYSTVCVRYLQDANHKMAHTILSRFYSLCLRNEVHSVDNYHNFILATKTVAAFFTIWRSALTNTGLDDIYRKLLQEKMSWEKGNSELTIEALKIYFTEVLDGKGIGEKQTWKNKAIQNLRYDSAKAVCKFALLVTSHDTIPDTTNPGLIKPGKLGSSFYLEPTKWLSNDIEHIAPQNPSSAGDWDNALYSSNDDYEQIGNLLLLPTKINSSASNKGWIEKWMYYQHLAETDPTKLANLSQEAKKYGVKLNQSTINLLKDTPYKHHIESIVQLGASGKWDKAFVEKRTERICDILWERMYEWLS
jgi:ribosomal protein S30